MNSALVHVKTEIIIIHHVVKVFTIIRYTIIISLKLSIVLCF